MQVKIGRNDPCPCGSGKKLKKCCGGAASTTAFSGTDRERAFERMADLAMGPLGREDDEAFEEFWGQSLEQTDELSPELDEQSTAVLDSWTFFDRMLPDGRLMVDAALEQAGAISGGERAFLSAMRQSAMHLWEVEDVVPGVSLTLRDVLENRAVVVHERSGSRTITRHEWLAARVVPRGVSGSPEMERGLLHIPSLFHDSVRRQLTEARAAFLKQSPGADVEEFYKTLPPYFHEVWIGSILAPAVPELHNTDGERLLVTRVTYRVLDHQALERSLLAGEAFNADVDETDEHLSGHSEAAPIKSWTWTGNNQSGQPVQLGKLELRGDSLVLDVNSAERGTRGRERLESQAGSHLLHRATTHEDLTKRVQQAVRDRALRGDGQLSNDSPDSPEPDQIPAEAAEALILNHLARHYQAWLDDSIPALDGKSPREAAKSATLRGKLVELLNDLAGQYERALKTGEPAYDPSWMWGELGLAEGPAQSPPPLGHERIAQRLPGAAEACRKVADAERQRPGFDQATTVLSLAQCRQNLELRRFLQSPGRPANDDRDPALEASELALMVNFELHRRKAFWVDESLAFMLARTDIDADGSDLRVPFPAFALVYTDRHVLSLAERLLSHRPNEANSGHILKISTVYVLESVASEERALELTFAFDALGADGPTLLRFELPLQDDGKVQSQIDALCPRAIVGPAVEDTNPLRGLLTVTLNSILYATSPGADSEARGPAERRERRARPGSGDTRTFTSEEVYFLPGAIEISTLREYQALERLPEGRAILHRSMVRGHWRRAAKNWTDQSLRWISPYWKGPEMAAVVERAYRLTR